MIAGSETVKGLTLRSGSRLSNGMLFFDFDNTVTTIDVVDDLLERFSVDDKWKTFEEAWQAGKLGSKECLEGQLRSVRVSREALSRYLAAISIDSGFPTLLAFLKSRKIPAVIVSDGFSFIVREILRHQGITGIRAYCNRIRFSKDRLIPSFPYRDPNCPRCAHCKKRHLLDHPDKTLIYVGDGLSDVCAAQEADIVFAKGNLLEYLKKAGKACFPFKNLGEVHHLLSELDHESENA